MNILELAVLAKQYKVPSALGRLCEDLSGINPLAVSIKYADEMSACKKKSQAYVIAALCCAGLGTLNVAQLVSLLQKHGSIHDVVGFMFAMVTSLLVIGFFILVMWATTLSWPFMLEKEKRATDLFVFHLGFFLGWAKEKSPGQDISRLETGELIQFAKEILGWKAGLVHYLQRKANLPKNPNMDEGEWLKTKSQLLNLASEKMDWFKAAVSSLSALRIADVSWSGYFANGENYAEAAGAEFEKSQPKVPAEGPAPQQSLGVSSTA